MKKNVIIGSLVAGAFLLPAIVSAGVVSGRCDVCHTMHASQDGSTTTPSATLLRSGGCVGCHAEGGATNDGTSGKGGTYNAPQVHDGTTPLSGGYFSATGDTQHNTSDFSAEDGVFDSASSWNIPGGTTMAAQIQCIDCHDGSGSHHGGSGTSYRMISAVTGTGANDYGVSGTRSGNTYYAGTMNAMCGSCHGDFHGTGSGDTALGSYGAWIRHPVNISLAAADAATTRGYVTDYGNGTSSTDITPLGRNAGGTLDIVMCLSCHVAHGNAYNDMLSFSYADILAGGTNTMDGGCENCHSYSGNGY